MPQNEHFDTVILGSGQGGKGLAWHLARSGQKVAVVERRWVGGSCPAVACLPSKNEIWSARVAYLAQHAQQFGLKAQRGGLAAPRGADDAEEFACLYVEADVFQNCFPTEIERDTGEHDLRTPRIRDSRGLVCNVGDAHDLSFLSGG